MIFCTVHAFRFFNGSDYNPIFVINYNPKKVIIFFNKIIILVKKEDVTLLADETEANSHRILFILLLKPFLGTYI